MKIDLAKVQIGSAATPCSIALVELIRTMEKIDEIYARQHELTDAEDKLLSGLDDRRDALEAQIRREVQDKLGVDYAVLWQAITG